MFIGARQLVKVSRPKPAATLMVLHAVSNTPGDFNGGPAVALATLLLLTPVLWPCLTPLCGRDYLGFISPRRFTDNLPAPFGNHASEIIHRQRDGRRLLVFHAAWTTSWEKRSTA